MIKNIIQADNALIALKTEDCSLLLLNNFVETELAADIATTRIYKRYDIQYPVCLFTAEKEPMTIGME